MFDIFSSNGIVAFLYTLPVLLFSLSVHEFAHAFVAYKLGDSSQKALGRITLDPFKHIDLFGFLCIALCGFGWGKPVCIDDKNFKNKARGNMLVAFAGPAANLILSFLFTCILKLFVVTNILDLSSSNVVIKSIVNMIVLSIEFNIVFGIFNLIPIPPFDGSKVLEYFLPKKAKNFMRILEDYSFWIIIFMFVTNAGSYIISPIVNFIFGLLMKLL